MKKTIYFSIIIAMVILILTVGFYEVNLQKDNKQEIAKTNNELNIYETNTKIDNQTIQTSLIEMKASPNASIILKKHYKNCGHTTKDYATIPEELVNKTEEEVKKIYSDWNLQGFSPDEIVLYKEVDGICNEHYLVKEIDGVIGIYIINEKNEEELQEKTSIATKYLTDTDLKKIKEGIKAYGKEELNSILEDYE